MLTFAEQLAQLEAEVVRASGLSLKQFDELALYISRVSAMTGLSVEDVTQILQGASAHTDISVSELSGSNIYPRMPATHSINTNNKFTDIFPDCDFIS